MAGGTVSSYIDANTKQIAGVHIKRAGLTPSEVIRRLWHYIASTGEIPDFVTEDSGKALDAFDSLMRLRSQVPSGTVLDAMGASALRDELAARDSHVLAGEEVVR